MNKVQVLRHSLIWYIQQLENEIDGARRFRNQERVEMLSRDRQLANDLLTETYERELV